MTIGKPVPPISPTAADLADDAALHGQRLFQAVGDAALGRIQPDGRHRVLELHAVFGLFDGLLVGSDHLHAVLRKHTVAVQVQRTVQRRLAAHRGQQGVGLLLGDDLGQHLPASTCQVMGSM